MARQTRKKESAWFSMTQKAGKDAKPSISAQMPYTLALPMRSATWPQTGMNTDMTTEEIMTAQSAWVRSMPWFWVRKVRE